MNRQPLTQAAASHQGGGEPSSGFKAPPTAHMYNTSSIGMSQNNSSVQCFLFPPFCKQTVGPACYQSQKVKLVLINFSEY